MQNKHRAQHTPTQTYLSLDRVEGLEGVVQLLLASLELVVATRDFLLLELLLELVHALDEMLVKFGLEREFLLLMLGARVQHLVVQALAAVERLAQRAELRHLGVRQ